MTHLTGLFTLDQLIQDSLKEYEKEKHDANFWGTEAVASVKIGNHTYTAMCDIWHDRIKIVLDMEGKR